MGERLNIEILKNGKVLANSYYHWSGFTSSAINLSIQIVKEFDYLKKYYVEKFIDNQDLLFAIRLLEETGAGIIDKEKARRILGDEDDHLRLNSCQDRNKGIISICEDEINETRNWEEERVSIDIEKKTINFGALRFRSKEEIMEAYDIKKIESIDEINMNFLEIKFEDIFNVKAFIDKAIYMEKCIFYNKQSECYIRLII